MTCDIDYAYLGTAALINSITAWAMGSQISHASWNNIQV